MKVLRCKVCKHPKLEEINQAVLGGVSQADVIRTIAPELSPASVQHHFAKDHHLRDLSEYGKPELLIGGTKKTIETTTNRTIATSKGELKDLVKVHWEIPRSLVKKLKHKAIDKDVPTVELVRQYLRYGVDHL